MTKNKKLSLMEYLDKYGMEEKCREYLFKHRWSEGFVYPKCGGKCCYSLKNGHYQYSDCRYHASVIAGMVMHRSNVPLTNWFLAFYFVADDKSGISSVQLANQISVTYKTAWYMLARIRKEMGQQDSEFLEFDDTYIGAPTSGKKCGRGH